MREAPVKTTGFLQAIITSSTKAKERIGTLRILEDGRKFRYAKFAADVSVGNVVKMRAAASDHIDCSITNLNSTNTQVEVTVSAGTALASNDLAGGYLHINDGTAEGKSFRIDSNTALSDTGTTVTLAMCDRVTGYDGTSEVTLIPSPWFGVTAGSAA